MIRERMAMIDSYEAEIENMREHISWLENELKKH